MKINLDYKTKVDPANKEKVLSNQELTFDYIAYAVNTKYEKGLEGQLRRVWGRIQRKFDDVILANGSEIELEDAEKTFIKKAFDEAKFPPQIAKYISILEEEIEKL